MSFEEGPKKRKFRWWPLRFPKGIVELGFERLIHGEKVADFRGRSESEKRAFNSQLFRIGLWRGICFVGGE